MRDPSDIDAPGRTAMSSTTETRLDVALTGLRETLTDSFHPDAFGQPEDQLKGPIQAFVRQVGNAFGARVRLHSEHRIPQLGARPDLRVEVNGVLGGYIELKAPGRGAIPQVFKGREAEEWEKLQNLPNLIYTDSETWALYRTGKLRGSVVGTGNITSGEVTPAPSARRLFALLHDFLTWKPSVPTSLKALADVLAPLCRLLRQDVLDAIARPDSALSILAEEWRSYLFADADDSQFADAYAQTLTYAMLLARLEGASSLHSDAARVLDRHHGLLAQVLRVLGQPQARKEIEIPVTLLEQSIEAVDHRRLAGRHGEPWLYFYETFLASYDSKLRRERGVYYTPAEVVEVQTSLVAELLQDRFGKRFTFVDDDVTVLDPAVGTGTYLLTALQIGLNQVRLRYGLGAEAHRATTAAHNFHGFEILVGPYAVAQLRLAQQIMDLGGSIPEDGLGIYLTDTLESPWKTPGGQLNLLHQRLVEENRRAREVKATTRVLVCIGNPPYHRGTDAQINRPAIRAGNWVRDGDDGRGGILEDFIQPLRAAGLGVHAKNLYNEYVYFWRWALWKVLDSTGGPGIVSFITASSYLRGPGFAGMRQVMRQTFDRIWILDLEGDITGSRKTDNIFATTTPVAIAIGVRYGEPQETTPAFVRYARIRGTRPEKLRELKSIRQLDDVQWQDCKSDWLAPFSPKAVGRYFDWPLLADLFPWQHSGVQFKRTWPIAPSREQLERRWKRLLTYPPGERAVAFRETPDREVRRAYSSLGGSTPCHRCRISMRPRRHHRYSATPIEASTGNGYCSTTVSATVSGPSSGRSILMSRFTSLVSLRELSDQARRQPRRLTFLTCITSEVPMAAPTSSPSGVIERLLVRT